MERAPTHARYVCRRHLASARWGGRRGPRCAAAAGGLVGLVDVNPPEGKAAAVAAKAKAKAPQSEAAVPTAPAEPSAKEFPGFPRLLWQTRSGLTGDPVRVIEVGLRRCPY